MSLDSFKYTEIANDRVRKDLEDFKVLNSKRIFDESGLDIEHQLWWQAYEAFFYLIDSNREFYDCSSELRRVMVLKGGGKYASSTCEKLCEELVGQMTELYDIANNKSRLYMVRSILGDKKSYSDLLDKKLIKEMKSKLRKHYDASSPEALLRESKKILRVEDVPLDRIEIIDAIIEERMRRYSEPISFGKDFKSQFKKYLCGCLIKRDTLIKLLFVLQLELSEFQDILAKSLFKILSRDVPEETALMFCLRWKLSWIEFMELRDEAALRLKEEIQVIKRGDAAFTLPRYDRIFSTAEANRSKLEIVEVEKEDFIKTILADCCRRAAQKFCSVSQKKKQYSQSAWCVLNKKIFSLVNREEATYDENGEVKRYTDNGRVVKNDKRGAIWYSGILTEYFKLLRCMEYGFPNIPGDGNANFDTVGPILAEYGFPNIPGDGNGISLDMYHRFFNYRIRRPHAIDQDGKGARVMLFRMDYGELDESIRNVVKSYVHFNNLRNKKYYISRNDILNSNFYYLLMRYWKDKNKVGKWDVDGKDGASLFEDTVNEDLKKCGYERLSNKFLCDVLFKFVLNSHYPLEIYTRIFELNVISSYFNELGKLKEAYEKLQKMEELKGGDLDELSNRLNSIKGQRENSSFAKLVLKCLEDLRNNCDRRENPKHLKDVKVSLEISLRRVIWEYMGACYPSYDRIDKVLNALDGCKEKVKKWRVEDQDGTSSFRRSIKWLEEKLEACKKLREWFMEVKPCK